MASQPPPGARQAPPQLSQLGSAGLPAQRRARRAGIVGDAGDPGGTQQGGRGAQQRLAVVEIQGLEAFLRPGAAGSAKQVGG